MWLKADGFVGMVNNGRILIRFKVHLAMS